MKMTDGTIVVTGATGGIGGAIARRLVAEGVSAIILACRNRQKAEALADSLRSEFPQSVTDIRIGNLDLASFASVRQFASTLRNVKISALINNAGIMPGKVTVTRDGIESATETNVISTALLTELLLPSIADGGSIVMTTSVTRKIVRLRPDWIGHAASYHGIMRRFKTYGRSKLVLTHYAAGLSERLKPRGITVNCADPGVVDSGIIKMGSKVIDRLADIFFRPIISTPEQGANAALSAMRSDSTGFIFTPSGRSSVIPRRYLTDPLHSRVISQLLEAAGRNE